MYARGPVALWLAGHQIVEDGKFVTGPKIDDTRDKMLEELVAFVRSLVPINDAIIREQNQNLGELD